MGSELVAMSAPGGGPVTVREWLEHVQQGYSRFAPAFEAVGIDFLDNLAERDEDVRGLPPAEETVPRVPAVHPTQPLECMRF